VTLPEELFDKVERLRVIGHRSRSEVFQEALRGNFGEPVYEPTDERACRPDPQGRLRSRRAVRAASSP
jgi:metal-responsive CopG/Arc/MetJ family transcriptional regulator